MHGTDPSHPQAGVGILCPAYRATTVGIVALVSLLAFEHLAVATAMPLVATALDGHALYAAAFGVALASSIFGMVLAGRWSDRAGPAASLWSGCAAFVLGLVLAGAAPDMPVLVFGRALQGLGTGAVSVALYVLVGAVYPRALHPRIFATFAAAWVLPTIVGPALAGLIASQWGWRWVFFSAALLAGPAAGILLRGLGSLSRQRRAARSPLEPLGGAPREATASGVRSGVAGPGDPGSSGRPKVSARGGLLLALGTAASAGLLHAGAGGPAMALLPMALGAVGIAAWAPRLLPPGTLLARSGLPAVVALRGLAAAAFFSGEVLIPLMLIESRGLSAVQAGLVLSLGALGWSAGSWYQGRDRSGPAAGRRHGEARGRWADPRVRTLQLGMAAIAAGTLAVALVLLPAVPVGVAALAWVVAGVGIGMVYPTLSVLTLECAPAAEHGAATSALQLGDALFSSIGLAGAGALLAALQPGAPSAAYLAGLGGAALLSLAGALLASRAMPASAALA